MNYTKQQFHPKQLTLSFIGFVFVFTSLVGASVMLDFIIRTFFK